MATSDRDPNAQEMSLVEPIRDLVQDLLALEPDRTLVMMSFLLEELVGSIADRFVVATNMGLGVDSVNPLVSLLGDGLVACQNAIAVAFDLMNDDEAIALSNQMTEEAIEIGKTMRKIYEGDTDA